MSKNRDKEYDKEIALRNKDLMAKVAEYGLVPEDFIPGEIKIETIVDPEQDEKIAGLELIKEEQKQIIEEQLKVLKEQGATIEEDKKIIGLLEKDFNDLSDANNANMETINSQTKTIQEQEKSIKDLKAKNAKLKKALTELSTE